MNGTDTIIFLFAVLGNFFNLFANVFFIVNYTDLETGKLGDDYTNPIDMCNTINRLILPDIIVQAFISVMLLLNAHYYRFLLGLPLVLWNAYSIIQDRHLLDPTNIFRTLRSHKIESMAKLIYHFVLFFAYLYGLVSALVEGLGE